MKEQDELIILHSPELKIGNCHNLIAYICCVSRGKAVFIGD